MGIRMLHMNHLLRASFFFLFIILTAQPARAQFFKNLFGKKESHKKHTTKTKPAAQEPIVKKKQEIIYPNTIKKEHYRIDIIAPLYINEQIADDKPLKDKIPDKAMAGIEFFQGVKIAADTLNALGYHMDIYFHDVTDPAETVETLISKKQLDSTDLVIGLLPSHDVPAMAKFTEKRHINFISCLSPADGGIKNNPYFFLMQPALQKHCEAIKNAVWKKQGKANTILYYRTSVQADENAYHYLYSKDTSWTVKKIDCKTKPAKTELAAVFDSSATNVIVMCIVDVAYAEELLAQLTADFPQYKFEVYGMPSWKGMSAIHKADAFPNVGIYVTAPFYLDQNTPAAKSLDNTFRQQYNGRPAEYVIRGYETLYCFAALLNQYSTIFNKNLDSLGHTSFTEMNIKPQWDKELNYLYLENERVYIYRYQGGSYMIEK